MVIELAQMKTANRKKIYYIPGIISLTILPIIFCFYNYSYQRTNIKTVIKSFFWNPELPKKYPEIFKEEYPPKRNYEDIYLTGENESDKIKLAFSQIRVREILKYNDSTKGVHYHFGDSSEYWTFIKTLDIFQIEQAKTYMIYENDIWFMHYPLDTTIQTLVCGTIYNDNLPNSPKISCWTTTLEKIKPIWDSSWQVLLSYTVLLFFIGFNIFKPTK